MKGGNDTNGSGDTNGSAVYQRPLLSRDGFGPENCQSSAPATGGGTNSQVPGEVDIESILHG